MQVPLAIIILYFFVGKQGSWAVAKAVNPGSKLLAKALAVGHGTFAKDSCSRENVAFICLY